MNKYKNKSNISGDIIHDSRIEHNLSLEKKFLSILQSYRFSKLKDKLVAKFDLTNTIFHISPIFYTFYFAMN